MAQERGKSIRPEPRDVGLGMTLPSLTVRNGPDLLLFGLWFSHPHSEEIGPDVSRHFQCQFS